MITNSVRPLALKLVDAADITALTFVEALPSALEEASFMVRITNDSNTDVKIAFTTASSGGIVPNEFVIAGSSIELNFQTNASPNGYVCQLQKGTRFLVSGVPGVGFIYFSAYSNYRD